MPATSAQPDGFRRDAAAMRWYLRQDAVSHRAALGVCSAPARVQLSNGRDIPAHLLRHLRADGKRTRVPLQAQPDALERRYRAQLKRRVRQINSLAQLALQKEIARLQGSINERARADGTQNQDVAALLRVIAQVELAVKTAAAIKPAQLAALGSQLDLFTQSAVTKQVATVVAVDIAATRGVTTKLLDSWVSANVDLIKSLHGGYFDDLRKSVLDTVGEGKSTKSLSRSIQERFQVATSRADLIATDQIGTLNSQITQARQTALGIEEYTWRHSGDDRVRPLHRDIGGNVYSWEKGHPTEGHPGEPVRCFPSGTEVDALFGIEKMYRRWHSGKLTELVADDGVILRSTPNHPILTQRGWVPAQSINPGDQVFATPGNGINVGGSHIDDVKPVIDKVFDAGAIVWGLMGSPTTGMDFHGDATDEHVDIVTVDRGLPIGVEPRAAKEFGKLFLSLSDADIPVDISPSLRGFSHLIVGYTTAPAGMVRGCCKLLALIECQATHPEIAGGRSAAEWDAVLSKYAADGGPGDAVVPGDSEDATPSDVSRHYRLCVEILSVVDRYVVPAAGDDTPAAQGLAETVGVDAELLGGILEHHPAIHKRRRITAKRIVDFSGHVYNLQTASSWYVAEDTVVHNCRCTPEPIL